MVIFNSYVKLPDGTPMRIEGLVPNGGFQRSSTNATCHRPIDPWVKQTPRPAAEDPCRCKRTCHRLRSLLMVCDSLW